MISWKYDKNVNHAVICWLGFGPAAWRWTLSLQPETIWQRGANHSGRVGGRPSLIYSSCWMDIYAVSETLLKRADMSRRRSPEPPTDSSGYMFNVYFFACVWRWACLYVISLPPNLQALRTFYLLYRSLADSDHPSLWIIPELQPRLLSPYILNIMTRPFYGRAGMRRGSLSASVGG